MNRVLVVGRSRDENAVVAAAGRLRELAGELRTYAPVYSEELIRAEQTANRRSSVVWYSLAGAILGGAGGLLLTIRTALRWHFISGGKPVISVPPFLVISFELTMLFGGVLTFIAFLFHSCFLREPAFRGAYDAAFSDDHFGLAFLCDEIVSEQARHIMTACGIESVSIR